MAEIFIQEWQQKDRDGRRKLPTKSKEKINGEHAYACDNLTTWFRLGKYIIKHDTAHFLLGLLDEIGTDNVRTWEHNDAADRWEYVYHVDDNVPRRCKITIELSDPIEYESTRNDSLHIEYLAEKLATASGKSKEEIMKVLK